MAGGARTVCGCPCPDRSLGTSTPQPGSGDCAGGRCSASTDSETESETGTGGRGHSAAKAERQQSAAMCVAHGIIVIRASDGRFVVVLLPVCGVGLAVGAVLLRRRWRRPRSPEVLSV
jgi:hypothetical protein